MFGSMGAAQLAEMLQIAGSACQMTTAVVAVGIAMMTYRYTRRQSALTLINHNNVLANAVNQLVVQSPEARIALGRLQEPIVGCPDDAVLFMYLNYVHNVFRMHHVGSVGAQVWTDTLESCAAMLGRLSRPQVTRLLGRGYEARFQAMVLERFDARAAVEDALSCAEVVVLRQAA
jgi:hypothetical protein